MRAKPAVESEYDVVVIGSGLAGLTCAGVLAAAGKRVRAPSTGFFLASGTCLNIC